MQESRNERFVRIAESRTNKIIKMIRLLGNCSNRSNYSYTDEEVHKIFSTIESELKSTKAKFIEGNKKDHKFSLR